MYEWFNERRSLAGGIIFGGSGLGGVFFPLMASYLLDKVGYQCTLRVWAGMFAIVGSFAMLGAKPRIPVHFVRVPNRPYNLQRYLRQFRFVFRPLFLLNVVTHTSLLKIEFDDSSARSRIFLRFVIYAYIHYFIGFASFGWISGTRYFQLRFRSRYYLIPSRLI